MVKQQKYTASVDIWSSGVLLYAMTVGHFPFADADLSKTLQRIVYADPLIPGFISPSLADLLKKMLCKSPQNRITLDQIKQHPWFPNGDFVDMSRFIQSFAHFAATESEQNIDGEIVDSMASLGILAPNLRQHLLCKKHTDFTAAYRLLRKEKIVDQMVQVTHGAKNGKVPDTDFSRRKARGKIAAPQIPENRRKLWAIGKTD
jgi:serine/threonine protein kinase